MGNNDTGSTFRNLLQRQGYQDLDDVLAKGRDKGRKEGRDEGREEGLDEGREALRSALLDVLQARGLSVDESARRTVSECRDLATLRLWLTRAATAQRAAEIFDP